MNKQNQVNTNKKFNQTDNSVKDVISKKSFIGKNLKNLFKPSCVPNSFKISNGLESSTTGQVIQDDKDEGSRFSVLQLTNHFSRLSQRSSIKSEKHIRSSSHQVRRKCIETSLNIQNHSASIEKLNRPASTACHYSQTLYHKQYPYLSLQTSNSRVSGSGSFNFLQKPYRVIKNRNKLVTDNSNINLHDVHKDEKDNKIYFTDELNKISCLCNGFESQNKDIKTTHHSVSTSHSSRQPQSNQIRPSLPPSNSPMPSHPHTSRQSFLSSKSLRSFTPHQLSPRHLPLQSSKTPPPLPLPPSKTPPTSSPTSSKPPFLSPQLSLDPFDDIKKMKRKEIKRLKGTLICKNSLELVASGIPKISIKNPLTHQSDLERKFKFNKNLPPAPGKFKKKVYDYPSKAYMGVVVACSSFIIDDLNLY